MYQIEVNNKSNAKNKVVIYCFSIMLLIEVSPSAYYKTLSEDFSCLVTDDYYAEAWVFVLMGAKWLKGGMRCGGEEK